MFRPGLVGLVLAATVARCEIIEQVLVKVNGEILTKTELETRQVQALRPAISPSTWRPRKAAPSFAKR